MLRRVALDTNRYAIEDRGGTAALAASFKRSIREHLRAMGAFGAFTALLVCALIFASPAARAGETTNFSYDAQGRLVSATTSGTVNSGLSVQIDLDSADNRMRYVISGSGGGSGPPSFSINDVTVAEGGALTFTVTKTGPAIQPYSVNYATANGTAAGSDYAAASGTLTFAANETTKIITVATIDDALNEATETVLLNLSGGTGGTTITDAQGVGTITDNDATVYFAINDVLVAEGGILTFTVTKSGATSQSLSVNYATADGTATAGSDYTAASGTLTFAAGDTTKTISIATTDDTLNEASETVLLNLSGATGGAGISDTQGIGTIADNDAAPSFSINDVSVAEGGVLSFTVTKTGSTSQSFSVNYATADGTATAGSDYTAASGTLTFAAGDTTKTISVTTTNDTVNEASETALVNLSGATGGATISDTQGVGTITDNDAAPAFSINDVSVTEGGILSFTVTKAGSTSQSFNVNYATADGTATAGSDYTAASGTLTFAAAETAKTISVMTIDDVLTETSETLVTNLSGATGGATISDSQGAGTIVDNEIPNTPPTPVNDSATVPRCDITDINVVQNDTDPDGDYPLSLVSISGTSKASIVSSTTIRFNATASSTSGNYTITYTVKDSRNAQASAQLVVTVPSGGACQ